MKRNDALLFYALAPPPASLDARNLGCICNREANRDGVGDPPSVEEIAAFPHITLGNSFTVTKRCPLHGKFAVEVFGNSWP